MAALDIWLYYTPEDLSTGPVYDHELFSPSFRKQTNRTYEPVVRQGYNNNHVVRSTSLNTLCLLKYVSSNILSISFAQEQTYALLGLREGDDAVGWQEAWEEAEAFDAHNDEAGVGELDLLGLDGATGPSSDLGDTASADFEHHVLRRLASPSPPPSTPPPAATLKAIAAGARRSEESEIDVDAEEDSGQEDEADIVEGDDVAAAEVASLASVATESERECREARRAVMEQHRTATLRRLNCGPAGEVRPAAARLRSLNAIASSEDLYDVGAGSMADSTSIFEQVRLVVSLIPWSAIEQTSLCSRFRCCRYCCLF